MESIRRGTSRTGRKGLERRWPPSIFNRMKRVSPRRKPAGPPHRIFFPVTDRRLVLVDDAPLRKKATSECTKAMEKLDLARAELKQFELEERPAFGSWMATTFGPLMTRLRENAHLIMEKEDLIEEVEMEMFWEEFRTPGEAYAAVIKRRENPDGEFEDEIRGNERKQSKGSKTAKQEGEEDLDGEEMDDFNPFDDDFDELEEGAFNNMPDSEAKELFEDFLVSVMGMEPKWVNPAQYAEMFSQFKAEVLGKRSKGNPAPHGPNPRERPESQRIKEIYRILVRRLHPDLRADGDAQVSAIWHEVQEAYETGNLERMETLLALTEIQNGVNGGKASLSHMKAALAELKRALRAIQKSIQEARRNPAWGFSKMPDRSKLKTRIQREIEGDLFEQRKHLEDLERIIARWTRPVRPKESKRPKSKPAQSKKTNIGPKQAELFPF